METNRLIIRPPVLGDLEAFHLLNQDKDFQSNLGGSSELSVCERVLKCRICDWQNYGYGMQLLLDRETGAVIGYCRLRRSHLEPPNDIEVVYGLLEGWRKKGLMREAVFEVIRCGLKAACTDRIIARVEPQNSDSVRVLLHLGFQRFERDLKGPDSRKIEHLYFVTSESLKSPRRKIIR